MVVTRAQEFSTSLAERHRQGAEPSKVNPLAPQAGTSAPPSPPLPQQDDRIAALAMQVQSLVAAIQVLQQQSAVVQRQSESPSSIPGVVQPSQHSSWGRSPLREVLHRRASPIHHRRKASKRIRPPSRHASAFQKQRHGREVERTRLHHCNPSPSLESSREGSFDGRIAHRAERRLDEYNQRLEELSRRITNPPEEDYDSHPSLSRHIMEELILTRFFFPQLDPYDGTADPLDHLESYKVLMQVQGATNSLLCIAFPATLRKTAQAYYSRLPPHSINSFQQLERAFLAHFDECRKIPRMANSLFFVQQKSGESLRDLIARFKETALEVYNLEDFVATLALKRGLRPSRFAYSLDKKPPGSYAELLSRVQKYIRADEADSSRREADGSSSKKQARPEPAEARPRRPEPSHRPNNRPRALAPREGPFTPLLAPISHIMMEIEGESYLQRPPPMKPETPTTKISTAASTGTTATTLKTVAS